MGAALAAVLALLLAALLPQPGHALIDSGRTPADTSATSACDRLLHRIYTRRVVIDPPLLKGYWISDSCETRPGPEFLLRKYHFINDTYFRALQFYFADSFCTEPLFGLEAKGAIRLAGNTMATELLTATHPTELLKPPTLYQVSVMPYTKEAAQQLQRQVSAASSDCSRRFSSSSWDTRAGPFDILSFVEYGRQVMQDYDCTRPLGFNLHELQLIRVERQRRGGGQFRQLFLGDIATSLRHRHTHRPTSFQTPLQDINNGVCHSCYSVLHASLRQAPQMQPQAVLTTYPSGEWVSTRCESRPGGNFVTRRLIFGENNQSWTGIYEHFHDPLCRRPFFSFTATGRVRPRGPAPRLPARRFDFHIVGLSVTPRDTKSAQQLNAYHGYGCGRSRWRVNRTQDVTVTSGCEHLHLVVPSTSWQVMSQQIVGDSVQLRVGAIANSPSGPGDRPTSFQPPLLRCRDPRRPPIWPMGHFDPPSDPPPASAGRQDSGEHRAVSAASVCRHCRCLLPVVVALLLAAAA